MRTPPTALGSFLRSRRTSIGLSAKQVADFVDVTRQTVSDWELGKGRPKQSKHQKLAEILNVPVEELGDSVKRGEVLSTISFIEPDVVNGEKLRLLESLKTLDEILEEQASLDEKSTVVIASLFESKEADNSKVAKTVARNLDNGIKYIYAFNSEKTYKKILEVLAEELFGKGKSLSEKIRPKFYDLSSIEKLEHLKPYEREDIYKEISTAAVFYDERHLGPQKKTKLRGYKFLQFPRDPDNDKMVESMFLPISLRTARDFVNIAERDAV